MKIPRHVPDRGAPGSGRPAAAASLAVAAAIVFALPRPAEGPDADAAADGIERAARCDGHVGRALDRWSGCIADTLHALPRDPVAAAAVHFHAWRVAHRAARAGAPDAAVLRDAHGRRLREALRDNLTSLHRLCVAAGEDCDAVGQALVEPG